MNSEPTRGGLPTAEPMSTPPENRPSLFEPEPPAGAATPVAPAEPRSDDSLAGRLTRLERILGDIRASVDSAARERRHKEFSPARLIGALLQALVVGLLTWALSDWVFQINLEWVLVKLAFAGVMQLIVLTAFLVARDPAPPA